MRTATLLGHERPIARLRFNADGDLLLAGCQDSKVSVWATASSAGISMLGTYDAHYGALADVDVDPTSRLVLSGSADGAAHLWALRTGRAVRAMLTATSVRAVAFSPSAKYALVLTATRGKSLACLHVLRISNELLEQADKSLPLLLPSEEKKSHKQPKPSEQQQQEAEEEEEEEETEVFEEEIEGSVRKNEEATSLARAEAANLARVFEVQSDKSDLLVHSFTLAAEHTSPTIARWGQTDETLFIGHENGLVTSYALTYSDNGMVTSRLKEASAVCNKAVLDIQVSLDRAFLVVASADTSARIVTTAPKMHVVKAFATERPVNSAAICPLRNHVILGGGQSAEQVTTTSHASGKFESRFFHTILGQEFARVGGHFSPISSVTVHPLNTMYATGSIEGNVKLYYFDSSYFTFQLDDNDRPLVSKDKPKSMTTSA